MTANILLTNQASQLTPWSTTWTIAARSGTWSTYVPRLFFNSTYLARLRANWADSYYSRIVTSLSGSTSAIHQALTYLATGNTANVTTAYNTAMAQTYSLSASGGHWSVFSDDATWVLDWCWPALTGTQVSNLVAKIDSNTNSRKTSLNTQFQLHEAHLKGFHGYLMGALAIQGETGSTADRRSDLTHAVQNYEWWLAEMSSGFNHDYNYQHALFSCVEIVWKLATGQDVEALSGNTSYLRGRMENAVRNMLPDLSGQWSTDIGDQQRDNEPGLQDLQDQAFLAGVAGAWFNDPVNNYLANVMTANGTKKWCSPWNSFETTTMSWMILIFWDRTATQTAPSVGWPLSRAWLTKTNGDGVSTVGGTWANLRSGWSLTSGSTDIVCSVYGSALMAHPEAGPGHIAVQRGMDALLIGAGNYCGSPSNINTNWSAFSFHLNCPVFSPSGSATPDQDGSARSDTGRRNTESNAAFPASTNLIWTANSGSWIGPTVTDFKTSATEAMVHINGDKAWPTTLDPMTFNRYVSLVAGSKLIVVRDVYTLANPGRNRFNWWGRALPTQTGSSAVITRGSSQATIQCMDGAATLTLFGGAGNEQVIDGVSWPVNTANCQSGKPVATLAAAIANQGRATFEVASNQTETVHAITIDASGTTAPTYTLAQLKTLAPLAFGATPIMPGFTQLAQKAILDSEFNTTRYLALFTTVGSDDGTGFVEVSGNAYARVAIASGDWNAATGGSPAVKTNSATKTFPTATASWGTIAGWGIYDASTSGNLREADYLGNFAWVPFTCSSASPGVITCPAHGYSNGDQVAVTNKYGGTLPATGGTWVGLLTVANVTTDTFTVGVNTTGTGDGMIRKVATQAIGNSQFYTLGASAITVTLG